VGGEGRGRGEFVLSLGRKKENGCECPCR